MKLPSMSDDDFRLGLNFNVKVQKHFGISRSQADFLIFSAWRKFKLVLAKDKVLRDKLKGFL